MVTVLVFCHNLECIYMDIGIPNNEGHTNCMIGSKVKEVIMHFYTLNLV